MEVTIAYHRISDDSTNSGVWQLQGPNPWMSSKQIELLMQDDDVDQVWVRKPEQSPHNAIYIKYSD